MRIPKDIMLSTYIRELYREDKIVLFYKSEDWRELRAKVLDDHHNECQNCLNKGRYTKADCVHHVNEVRHRPDLALSEFFVNERGERKRNLIALCNTCHNVEHEKLEKYRKENRFTNEERW